MTETKKNNINNFDLIRLLAASQVLLFHSIWHLQITAYSQWIHIIGPLKGVPIFFVISGFLISASIEQHFEIKKYCRNRILRIYPGLWFCIIVSICTIYFVADINFFHWQGMRWLLSQCLGIIYTPSFLKGYGFGSYNGSLWTIPVELQFYVLLPLLYFLMSLIKLKEHNKTISIFLFFLLFSLIAYRISRYNYPMPASGVETTSEKLLQISFVPHFYLFLLGVLLQRLRIYQYTILQNKGLFWLIAYLGYSFLITATPLTILFGNIFLGICVISLAYSYPGFAGKMLKGTDISYGVYLYHGLVLGVLVQLKITGSVYCLIIVLVASYMLAFLSWKLIEQPFLRMKNKSLKLL